MMSMFAPGFDQRFLIEDYQPNYLRTWREGAIDAKVAAALEELADCRACPRDCGVNRLVDEQGCVSHGALALRGERFYPLW
jgi:uncharacterized Fe-S radical SAM superfamily protein PflX